MFSFPNEYKVWQGLAEILICGSRLQLLMQTVNGLIEPLSISLYTTHTARPCRFLLFQLPEKSSSHNPLTLIFMTSRTISKGYFLLLTSVLACVPNSCFTCFLFSVIVISYLPSFFYFMLVNSVYITRCLTAQLLVAKITFVELSTKIGEHLGTQVENIKNDISMDQLVNN